MSTYTIYRADYNPNSSHIETNPLNVVFDQGNPAFDSLELTTADDKYQRIVHRSIDHLYYRDFYTNTKATFGSGNINMQDRSLEDVAYIVSMPQSKFGEAIMPSSVEIDMRYYMYNSNDSEEFTGVWKVMDDGFGNLRISSSSYRTPYNRSLASATNGTASISKPLAGQWPQDDVYKYVTAGPVDVTQDFNKGLWQMQADYNNVKAIQYTGSLSTSFTEKEFLGAAWYFTASLSSSITIKPNIASDYSQRYNFQNEDFTINFIAIPSQLPTHPSGSILLTKQGPVDQVRVDENGNVYSNIVSNKTPYRLTWLSGSNVVQFEVDAGDATFNLTSSVSLSVDNLYHVTARKSGSLYTLQVYNNGIEDVVSGSCAIVDKRVANAANVFVGNNHTGDRGFNGVIDNLKMYKGYLSNNEVKFLWATVGAGTLNVGNVFYNHGMMVLTGIPIRCGEITQVDCRGTHTIWETEISCTVNPGEFGMSCNPTLQEYDPVYNEYVYRPFVTSSEFKPYITTIGLYDDAGRLLAIGKVNTPIQTPNNTDTTFIVRFDR